MTSDNPELARTRSRNPVALFHPSKQGSFVIAGAKWELILDRTCFQHPGIMLKA